MARITKEGEDRIDEVTVKRWLDQMHKPDVSGSFFKIELGKALEANDPVAEDFLRKAAKLQPDYIRESAFREHAERLKRQDMLRSRETE